MAEEEANMSEDEMMAAMEAAAAEPLPEGDEMGDGTLSQDEIDNLLGFSDDLGLSSTGVQALLDHAQDNYERLPMLEVVFDRFVRSMSTSMRNLTGENADVSIESITSMRFEDYLNSVPLPALIAIFQAVEWENYGLVTINSELTYSIVDILLGGGKNRRSVRVEGRPFTTIEQDIIKNLCRLIMEEMTAAFNPLTPATFRLDRLETNPRFATITRLSNPVILITLRVDIDEHGGQIEILLPYVTLEPIKELLLQMFAGESFGGSDMSWENHLTNELADSTVDLEAVLKTKQVTLKDLANLKVGSTLVMNHLPDEDVTLLCQDIRMAAGKLGASDNKLAISVTENVSKDDVMDLV